MTAEEIVKIVTDAGLTPIARLSLLNDNNKYGGYRLGCYRTTDGDTWLDNSPQKGGKPWLSPFDDECKNYISYIVDEVSKAGFKTVICSGVVFPPFKNSDLTYIGSSVTSSDRYKALIDVVNTAKAAAEQNGAEFELMIDVNEILNGSELFKPDELGNVKLLVCYNPTNVPNSIVYNNEEVVFSDMTAGQKAQRVFEIAADKCGAQITIIPCISYSSVNQTDYNDILTAIIGMGYNSYVVE